MLRGSTTECYKQKCWILFAKKRWKIISTFCWKVLAVYNSNRERKERYHEVGRNAVPLEWGASADTVVIPNPIQHVFWKQILKGEFLDAIFDCPLEMHELVEDADISASIKKLKYEHKEILYYLAIRQYSNQRVACIREQSDRNIRKVRDTVIRKLRKSLLATLQERIKNKIPLTNIERDFLSEYGNNDGCTD